MVVLVLLAPSWPLPPLDRALHQLRRATGVGPALADEVSRVGLDGWLDAQLRGPVSEARLRPLLAARQRLVRAVHSSTSCATC